MNTATDRDAMHVLRFAGKFLAVAVGVVVALWAIGASFALSRWAGLSVGCVIAVALYVTARNWVIWLPGVLIFGVLNSIFGLVTHRAPTNPSAVVSTGFAALWLIYYGVGSLISYHYDATRLTPLDRCAFVAYLGSIAFGAYVSRDNAGIVTPALFGSAVFGMIAILASYVIHRHLRRADCS